MANRIRVLLVEDHVVAAEGLRLALSALGFYVQVIHSGRETIGQLLHFHADALVIDLSLPDIDGAVVAELVRQTFPDLPIVITTGHNRPVRIASLLQNGKTVFLQKPYEIADLVHAIETRVGRPAATTDTPARHDRSHDRGGTT